MKYALELWYFTETNHADDPIVVGSESELDQVLDEVLAHEQPHPTVVCAHGRPTLGGPLNLPDHQLKFDVDRDRRMAAIHVMGMPEFLPSDQVLTNVAEMRAWVSLGPGVPVGEVSELYIDFDTRTRFPADSVISLEKLREALRELAATGRRPTCVAWQETDVY